MAKKSTEDLATFLKRQKSDVLVGVLLELAGQYEGVNDRLERLQLADRPDKIAADFRKTLAAWRRSKKFYSYRESCAFGLELERWLMQVGSELAPKDPAAALALFESFIESDASWFEQADDSDGCIGDAMRCACEQWLEAARRCESPPDEWPPRIVALHRADEYGGRETLLRHADRLLGVDGLRLLVAEFEKEMAQALSSAVGVINGRAGLPSGFYKLSGSLSLLSEALHDPDVLVRSVCSYSPQPNGLQKESFVVAYLKENRANDAMRWLADAWEPQFEGRRQSLLSDTLARLGRGQESAQLRQQLFEKSLSVYDYQRWIELLPESAHPEAHEQARQLALVHSDPSVAAQLLLAIDEARDAETKLIGSAALVDGRRYDELPKMADTLLAKRCFRGASVVYRALLNSILERANSVAYGHAARYWWKLNEIDAACETLVPLVSHAEYEAAVRAKNPRKVGFWAQVNAKGERLASAMDPTDTDDEN